MRILYVEDHPVDADLTLRQLRKVAPQFQCEVVGTVGEAVARLEQLSDQPLDLVLTDMRLPDGNGLSLVAHIRERALPVAIVVVTGTGDEETAVAVLKAGADDYVVKRQDYLETLALTLESAFHHYCAGAARRARLLRVLYVEHDPVDIDLTRRHFEKHAAHIQLDILPNASEILERFNRGNGHAAYDVLLLDYRLPGVNALELLKKLKLTCKTMPPVILVTGKGSEEVAWQAVNLGATSYVVKSPGYLYKLGVELENASFYAELTRREEALRTSQERYILAASAGGVTVWELDLETGEVLVDLATLSHLPSQDPQVLTFQQCQQLIHPDDWEHAVEHYRCCLDSLVSFSKEQSTIVPEIALRVCQGGGETRWVLVRGTVLKRDDGQPYRVLGTVTDITERKRAEDSLRVALAELEQLKERVEAENVYLRKELKDTRFPEFYIGESSGMKKVRRQIDQVAGTDMTVLVLGETGVGKELVARAVHQNSSRRDKPLVTVNCSALPAELIESELFGHEKGAFTGALSRQPGRFELAHEGTLFLDEIGELPLHLQAKLLRVLQDGVFERLGSGKSIKVNVRMIAATNRDIGEAIQKGEFRTDLFFRLNVFPIHVPPLRERKQDIGELAAMFLKEARVRMGGPMLRLSPEVLGILENYDWPGNIRELRNVIERATLSSTGSELALPEDWIFALGTRKQTVERPGPMQTSAVDEVQANLPQAALKDVEREHILSVLEQTKWRIEGPKGAAVILGLRPSTLRSRMRKYGIQ